MLAVADPTSDPCTPNPPRVDRRLSIDTASARSSDQFFSPTDFSFWPTPGLSGAASPHDAPLPTTPDTPTYPPASYHPLRRKSANSIRLKPVPSGQISNEVLDLHPLPSLTDFSLSQRSSGRQPATAPCTLCSPSTPDSPFEPDSPTPTPCAPHSQPPIYILPVDPLPGYDTAFLELPYPLTTHHRDPIDAFPDPNTFHFDRPLGSAENLPRYAEETQTEPRTLARSLWRWGWGCPLLWAVGMCILWIPLTPAEEERDPEKAQKIEEMIAILRVTEVKYARRCLYAFTGSFILLAAIVISAVALSRAA